MDQTRVLYFAYKNGGKQHIASDDALDRMLQDGWDIIRVVDGKVDVIATPEGGWIIQRPVIRRTFSGRS